MTPSQVRVIVADDHPIVLQGLQRLFDEQPDLTVVAACRSGEDALMEVQRLSPDVLVVDLRMDGLSGLDVLRRLGEQRSTCRVVILTAAIKDTDVTEAVTLGVAGLLLKESAPAAMVECVRRVAAGERWIRHDAFTRALADALQKGPAAPQATVTPREREIIRLVAEGLRNKEIAARLGISEGTVKIHLHNIYDKLGVDSRLELVLAAQQKSLL